MGGCRYTAPVSLSAPRWALEDIPLRGKVIRKGEMMRCAETATHALRIICSGIFDAFPRAIMLLGHIGEALPYVLKRIDDGWGGTPQGKHLQHLPSYYIKNNVMITTSANCSPEALSCALLAIGADHLLFSTDYPYASMERTTRFVETAPISEMDREKIFHVNAERLLKLPYMPFRSRGPLSEPRRCPLLARGLVGFGPLAPPEEGALAPTGWCP